VSILKKGLKGAPVKRLQQKLGVTADGDFGPATERAVRDFQNAQGLVVDGIAGPDTFMAIGLPELVLLRRGLRGNAVRKLQAALHIDADGAFGKATEAALKDFQARNGLDPYGIAGPETLAKLGAIASISEATVKKAAVQPDEKHFDSEPLPEIKGTEVVAGNTIEVPEEKSVWGKIKGWFS